MILPNFLVIGAAKAGTTSLADYLRHHPQVYVTLKKETRFFSLEGEDLSSYRWSGKEPKGIFGSILDLHSYAEQFTNVTNELAIGEICPLYLYHPGTAQRIKGYIPDVKLIAILRNPVDRAYSHYQFLRQKRREPLEFVDAIQEEPIRIREKWFWDYYYIDRGFYYQQLVRYYNLFPQKQIRVFLFEDLSKNPKRTVQEIFDFLNIDNAVDIDTSKRLNVTKEANNPWVANLYDKRHSISWIFNSLPENMKRNLQGLYFDGFTQLPRRMSPVEKKMLLEVYYRDIEKLQDLIARDLSHWLR